MENKPLIYSKILAVMSDIKAIAKTQKADGFLFRGIDDVYNALQPLFMKHGIFCTPKITAHATNEVGKTITTVDFSFFAEDGSHVCCTTTGEAIDKGDKGSATAQSIAHRIALTQMFLIPTESDLAWFTPVQQKKAVDRILGGEIDLYFKIENEYRFTKEQKEKLQKAVTSHQSTKNVPQGA
jgi:hypothetical protein